MANILEIKNLVVSYGGIEAVKGIDLTVEEGKIVTLVGSNGAGKSHDAQIHRGSGETEVR